VATTARRRVEVCRRRRERDSGKTWEV